MDLTRPTVFIVDDDAHLRQLMQGLIESIAVPVAVFASADEFLRAYQHDQPGCLVTDVRMPGMSGLELQSVLLQRGVRLPVVVVTGHGDLAIGVRAMRSRAIAVLAKPFHHQEFIDSVQSALRVDAANRSAASQRADATARFASLTSRERQILAFIADGLGNKQMAQRLDLSEKTVEAYRAQLMKKLNVGSLASLVRFAIAAGVTKGASDATAG